MLCTKPFEKIMLRSTANQTFDRIDKEKWLMTQDPKLIHRYSVLVRLLVEQPDTYNYFNTLKELSVQSHLVPFNPDI